MKKSLNILMGVFFISFTLMACNQPSASEVASKFCSMVEKKHLATTTDEKKKIGEEMEAYEKKIKSTYKDKEYQKSIKKSIDECLDELETKYGDIDR